MVTVMLVQLSMDIQDYTDIITMAKDQLIPMHTMVSMDMEAMHMESLVATLMYL